MSHAKFRLCAYVLVTVGLLYMAIGQPDDAVPPLLVAIFLRMEAGEASDG